jgi:hypothetical protein
MKESEMDDRAQIEELKRRATELANANHSEMQGMSKRAAMRFVREILADNEVVFGIWQDFAEPNGVGMLVVKGIAHLRDSIAHGFPIKVKISAVPCVCHEQALALRQVHGDKPDA